MPHPSEFLMSLLTQVIDPEIGINIVDMGLVYGITEADGVIQVEMTLTTQGCPMGSYMTSEVQSVLGSLAGIRAVNVDIVWSPPWTSDKIKPGALENRGETP